MINPERTGIKFKHLYGAVFAAFRGKATKKKSRNIVFPPEKFTPQEDQEYEVYLLPTRTGEFVYQGETFRVVRTRLVTEASVIDEIDYTVNECQRRPVNTLAAAFRKAGLV